MTAPVSDARLQRFLTSPPDAQVRAVAPQRPEDFPALVPVVDLVREVLAWREVGRAAKAGTLKDWGQVHALLPEGSAAPR